MSKPGGRRAPKSSARSQPPAADETPAAPSRPEAEAKEEPAANGDKKEPKNGDEAAALAPKPQSAGATMRDAANKLLMLTMKQEWTSIDPVLKQLDKIAASNSSEASNVPLAGVMDPVRLSIRLRSPHSPNALLQSSLSSVGRREMGRRTVRHH